jgi:hypothetical protein
MPNAYPWQLVLQSPFDMYCSVVMSRPVFCVEHESSTRALAPATSPRSTVFNMAALEITRRMRWRAVMYAQQSASYLVVSRAGQEKQTPKKLYIYG